MKFILGKKLKMTQIFKEDGTMVPVTAINAGPCLVLQKKNNEKDGYSAVKCAFEAKKKVNKPLLGIFKKFGKDNYQYIREFRMAEDDVMAEKINEGDVITAEAFEVGDSISVQGVSKGKGFQGVVKRHGFKGGKASHGHKDQLRMPGSIGSTGPARVFKGVRMGGRMGGLNSTVSNLEVIKIDLDNNILYISGAIPGSTNGLVKIWTDGEFEIKKPVKKTETQKDEATKEENISTKSEEKKEVVEEVEAKAETPEISPEEKTNATEPKEDKKEVESQPKEEKPKVEESAKSENTK